MAKRHWQAVDFRQTNSADYGREYGAVKGFCGKCGGDMQAFASDGWKLHHYNSHQETRMGAVGSAPTVPVKG